MSHVIKIYIDNCHIMGWKRFFRTDLVKNFVYFFLLVSYTVPTSFELITSPSIWHLKKEGRRCQLSWSWLAVILSIEKYRVDAEYI